ncbi:hypothetical protein C8J56DRAFT_1122866 [Mycena floridula]|nr:hypothetical protein C8J56DRAFT_1122866 [Mycena floridula]
MSTSTKTAFSKVLRFLFDFFFSWLFTPSPELPIANLPVVDNVSLPNRTRHSSLCTNQSRKHEHPNRRVASLSDVEFRSPVPEPEGAPLLSPTLSPIISEYSNASSSPPSPIPTSDFATRRGFKGAPLFTQIKRKSSAFLSPDSAQITRQLSPISPRYTLTSVTDIFSPTSPKPSVYKRQVVLPWLQDVYDAQDPFYTNRLSFFAPNLALPSSDQYDDFSIYRSPLTVHEPVRNHFCPTRIYDMSIYEVSIPPEYKSMAFAKHPVPILLTPPSPEIKSVELDLPVEPCSLDTHSVLSTETSLSNPSDDSSTSKRCSISSDTSVYSCDTDGSRDKDLECPPMELAGSETSTLVESFIPLKDKDDASQRISVFKPLLLPIRVANKMTCSMENSYRDRSSKGLDGILELLDCSQPNVEERNLDRDEHVAYGLAI